MGVHYPGIPSTEGTLDQPPLSSDNTTLSECSEDAFPTPVMRHTFLETIQGQCRVLRIMDEILSLNRSQARDVLVKKYGLNEEDALRVISLTHPLNSREIVIVIPDQMISSMAVRLDGSYTVSGDIYSRIWVRGNRIEEEVIDTSGKSSVVEMDGAMYLMNRKYRNSLLLRLLLGVLMTVSSWFMKIRNKVYILKNF